MPWSSRPLVSSSIFLQPHRLSGKGHGRLDAPQPPSPLCEAGPTRGWLLLVSSIPDASRLLWAKGFVLEKSTCLNTSYQFAFYWKVPLTLLNIRDQHWSLKFVRMVSHMYSQLNSVPLKINVDILTPIPSNGTSLETGAVQVEWGQWCGANAVEPVSFSKGEMWRHSPALRVSDVKMATYKPMNAYSCPSQSLREPPELAIPTTP